VKYEKARGYDTSKGQQSCNKGSDYSEEDEISILVFKRMMMIMIKEDMHKHLN
jgi:hypothetical protein